MLYRLPLMEVKSLCRGSKEEGFVSTLPVTGPGLRRPHAGLHLPRPGRWDGYASLTCAEAEAPLCHPLQSVSLS